MVERMTKQHRIAFITTPRFRAASPEIVADMVYSRLYQICAPFRVITTGRTKTFIDEIVARPPTEASREMIATSMDLSDVTEHDVERWRRTINGSLESTMDSFQGMIHVAYELVEGRLDGVIHFTDWEDKSAKPDSAVLAREANVHNVPFANDPDSAVAHINTWRKRLAAGDPVFIKREQPKDPPLKDLKAGDRVVAIISHDNMKLETCCFAVKHARHLFEHYDHILATGTTGGWLRRFIEATGRGPSEVAKIRLCNSGPKGGDIQIAYAVVLGICRKIIFLQDPSVPHPHDSDIRLFEQATLAKGVHVELATNVESARLLIGA